MPPAPALSLECLREGEVGVEQIHRLQRRGLVEDLAGRVLDVGGCHLACLPRSACEFRFTTVVNLDSQRKGRVASGAAGRRAGGTAAGGPAGAAGGGAAGRRGGGAAGRRGERQRRLSSAGSDGASGTLGVGKRPTRRPPGGGWGVCGRDGRRRPSRLGRRVGWDVCVRLRARVLRHGQQNGCRVPDPTHVEGWGPDCPDSGRGAPDVTDGPRGRRRVAGPSGQQCLVVVARCFSNDHPPHAWPQTRRARGRPIRAAPAPAPAPAQRPAVVARRPPASARPRGPSRRGCRRAAAATAAARRKNSGASCSQVAPIPPWTLIIARAAKSSASPAALRAALAASGELLGPRLARPAGVVLEPAGVLQPAQHLGQLVLDRLVGARSPGRR